MKDHIADILEDLANAISELHSVCEVVIDSQDGRLIDAAQNLQNARTRIESLRATQKETES